MKLCTKIRPTATHRKDGITVIDAADVIDVSAVEDNHRFGWAADGTFHLEAPSVQIVPNE